VWVFRLSIVHGVQHDTTTSTVMLAIANKSYVLAEVLRF